MSEFEFYLLIAFIVALVFTLDNIKAAYRLKRWYYGVEEKDPKDIQVGDYDPDNKFGVCIKAGGKELLESDVEKYLDERHEDLPDSPPIYKDVRNDRMYKKPTEMIKSKITQIHLGKTKELFEKYEEVG